MSSLSSVVHPLPIPTPPKTPHRKEGGKFGFAESIANQRITAFKMEKAPVDTCDVEEKAEEIIAEAEPPAEVYLYWMVFCFVLFFLSLTRKLLTLALLGQCEGCAR